MSTETIALDTAANSFSEDYAKLRTEIAKVVVGLF